MTVSQWADKERVLSPESSAEYGKWRTDRTPYLREIMDAFNDPSIETVVGMTSSQVGKTETINNVIGYFMDQDPAPIIVVEPTLEVAKSWSKTRLTAMLRDTPALRGKVRQTRSKDPDSTLLNKNYPGGDITITGSNAPASLRARPKRVALMDDIDAFGVSAGAEGDPIDLTIKRTATFWNRKIGLFSTPTLKGASRIELAYSMSDKRKYYVPCPFCEQYQLLLFPQLSWPEGEPQAAQYHCIHCNKIISNNDKLKMLKKGEWRSEGKKSDTAGFWINELYSPWSSFTKIAKDYVKAVKDTQTYKVFVNTTLAETWEDAYEEIDRYELMDRLEIYGPELPLECGVLTCAADIHSDRIESEVVGWGKGKESWGIEYKIFPGDPARPEVWNEFDEYLKKTWVHISGIPLRILVTCIDSGYLTDQVCSFVKNKIARHIIAVKGSSSATHTKIISDRPKYRRKKSITGKTNIYTIGTDKAKEAIFMRLKVTMPGPGYMHFPVYYTKDYFEQLTSERQKPVYRHGYKKLIWEKKSQKARNEALDIRVYNLAALSYLEQFTSFNLDGRCDELVEKYIARVAAGQAIQQITQLSSAITRHHGRKVRNEGIGG